MLSRILTIFCIITVCFSQTVNPAHEFLDGKKKRFTTQSHAKSKGVYFSFEYPNSWLAEEGDRPNVVQKFTSEYGSGLEMVIIITKHLGSRLTMEEQQEFFKVTNQKLGLPEGANFINAVETQIEALPAGILEYSMHVERAAMTMEIQSVTYSFIWGSTLVQFQCYVSSLNPNELGNHMSRFRLLFDLMANSIVIPDRWKD